MRTLAAEIKQMVAKTLFILLFILFLLHMCGQHYHDVRPGNRSGPGYSQRQKITALAGACTDHRYGKQITSNSSTQTELLKLLWVKQWRRNDSVTLQGRRIFQPQLHWRSQDLWLSMLKQLKLVSMCIVLLISHFKLAWFFLIFRLGVPGPQDPRWL